MNNSKSINPAFTDARGDIIDILIGETIDAVTIVTFEPGAVRANHYHKDTIQWNYVLEGEVLMASKLPFSEETTELVLKKGDLKKSDKYEAHALKGLTSAKVLILTRGPRGGENYEDDTFRLKDGLL